MCRGANLGVCCELGCDQRIQCRDTAGYCPAHDPHDWESPSTNVADDPEKRRVYNHGCVTRGIAAAEASLRETNARLVDLKARLAALARPPEGEA